MFRKKQKDQVLPQGKIEKIAYRIAHILLKFQLSCTGYLNRKTAPLSKQGKMTLLISICFLFGGLSLNAFLGIWKETNHVLGYAKPEGTTIPKYVINKNYNSAGHQARIAETEIARIRDFKNYLDSMNKTTKGRIAYDSIYKIRPGLIDSIKELMVIYQSQQKNN